jgi:hypothetical protein
VILESISDITKVTNHTRDLLSFHKNGMTARSVLNKEKNKLIPIHIIRKPTSRINHKAVTYSLLIIEIASALVVLKSLNMLVSTSYTYDVILSHKTFQNRVPVSQ